MKDNYRIDGSGKTTKDAERVINKNRKDLTTKFHKASVTTNLNVVDAVFTGVYDLKGKCKAEACETHFKIESHENFRAVTEKASKHEGYDTHYDTRFSVEEYIKLTKTQEKALNPPTKRTPAGSYSPRASSLDMMKTW